jgi:hypothetical protein
MQSQIFFAVIKNVPDLIADFETKFFIDRDVARVEHAMNIFSQQNTVRLRVRATLSKGLYVSGI